MHLRDFNGSNKGDENEKVKRSDEEEQIECFETFNNSDHCPDDEQNASQDVENSKAFWFDDFSDLGMEACWSTGSSLGLSCLGLILCFHN